MFEQFHILSQYFSVFLYGNMLLFVKFVFVVGVYFIFYNCKFVKKLNRLHTACFIHYMIHVCKHNQLFPLELAQLTQLLLSFRSYPNVGKY